jgi:F-type H+-transporting ATPase subunit delta
MNENVIAKRYAKGLAAFAAQRGRLAEVRDDLRLLADLLDPERGDISVPELRALLFSPTVTPEEKIRVTDVICEKLSIGQEVSDFLNVLIKKTRIGLIGMLERQYERLAADLNAEGLAEVRTARLLSPQQEESLRLALREATGKTVRLRVEEDKSLIAGVRVRMSDIMLDGSFAARLEKMESMG